MAYYKDEEKIFEGLTIYRIDRPKSKGWWYCYIRIRRPNKKSEYIRKSLKTTRKKEAEAKAKDLYYKYRAMVEEGLPVYAVSWSRLVEDYNKAVELSDTSLRRITVLGIYFSKFKDIKEITSSVIGEYPKFRKEYWDSPEGARVIKRNGHHHKYKVGTTTIRMEMTLLHSIMKWAFMRGLIPFVPEIKFISRNGRRKELSYKARGPITGKTHEKIWRYLDVEYRKIKKTREKPLKTSWYHHKRRMIERYGEDVSLQVMKDNFHKKRLLKNRRMRTYIHCLDKGFAIRCSEWKRLKWKHIDYFFDEELNKFILEVSVPREISKNRHDRKVFIIDHKTIKGDTLKGTLGIMLDEWKGISPNNKDSDFIFCKLESDDTDKPAEMGVYFSKILKALKLNVDEDGKMISAYSYRHKGITEALIKGWDVFQVAKICSTSPQQIQKHYEHVLARRFYDDLKDKEMKHIEKREKSRRRLTKEQVVDLQMMSDLS